MDIVGFVLKTIIEIIKWVLFLTIGLPVLLGVFIYKKIKIKKKNNEKAKKI